MSNRVERLRLWLLGSAGFLLLVICSFIGGAHYLRHHRLTLPSRLGVNIVRETNGYTYSQSMQGKTMFTIHAAKAVEHNDKKIALHDVSITLYGAKQDLNDRIYGDEFEYDQNAEVFRSSGVVHIDLQPAQASGGQAVSATKNPISAAAKMLHVTTSGLVFLKKLGMAATSEYIEFQSGAMAGHATGADYSSDTGVLMLHSAVSMSGRSGKRAVAVTAATANLDNRNQEAFLTRARYVSLGQAMEAQQATLHTRPDGTLSRVEAEGSVTMEANGATVVSQRADVALNATSQPQSAVLTGGVQYSSDKPLEQRSVQAEAASIAFDAQGQAKHAEFTGAVHMSDRTRATEAAKEPWSTHDLTAAKVEAALAPVSGGRAQPRDVEAIGSAHLAVGNNGSMASTRGVGRTELSADDLKVHLVSAKDTRQPPRLDTIAGRGHTLLHQVTADGVEQTSAGDSLDAKFRASEAPSVTHGVAANSKGVQGVNDLLSAVQQGHVSMTRRAPAKNDAKVGSNAGNAQQVVERATAERAAYDGDPDRVTLSGGAQVSDGESMLWANQVSLDRKTGNVQALGAVKGNYAQENSAHSEGVQGGGGHAAAPSEPTHILADRAELDHASGVATFFGRPVRLWQGGSQVQAPVIEFARKQQRLTALGEAAMGGAKVHTVLASAGNDRPAAAKSATSKPNAPKAEAGKAGPESRMPSVVRIASDRLVYSGDLRQAEFSGGVRAETVDGTLRANQAMVYLQQTAGTGQTSGARGASAAAGASSGDEVLSLAGSVERMVATGQIEIEQPGRRATGGRLVYTASDQLFVLTGDCKVQPKLVDAAHGTVTGATLRFHTGDNSVVVSHEATCMTGETGSQRIGTETDAGNDATIEKGKQ